MIWDTGTAISKCIHVSFCGFMSGGWWRFAIRTQRPILNARQMHCHLQEKLFLSQLLRRTISGGLYKRVPRTWSSSPSKSAGPPVFCGCALKFWVIIVWETHRKSETEESFLWWRSHWRWRSGGTQIKIERHPLCRKTILRPAANRTEADPIKRCGTHLARDYFNYDVLHHHPHRLYIS